MVKIDIYNRTAVIPITYKIFIISPNICRKEILHTIELRKRKEGKSDRFPIIYMLTCSKYHFKKFGIHEDHFRAACTRVSVDIGRTSDDIFQSGLLVTPAFPSCYRQKRLG